MNRIIEFQSLVFKLRGGIWTALYIAVLYYAQPSSRSIPMAILFVSAGQLLRFWAAGNIGLYRGEKVKARELVTWGPYSLIRNPLYLANGMIGAGWSLMGGRIVFLLFLLVFFSMYNLCIIPHEESYLEKAFGQRYLQYKQRTGRFIPRRFEIPGSAGNFDPSVLLRSEIHSLLVTIIGTFVLVSRIWW
ncbi:MAG: isoprenylcysteine carboxylmethyltransferase family protein [Synergistales bacterium]|nr:isoprenylcysteine carboxylmethyltransferase family protein [Synergistales bacterium]